eukprot:scaffold1643_cov390-Prasinococcus_capsulatus_cf.AAC.11
MTLSSPSAAWLDRPHVGGQPWRDQPSHDVTATSAPHVRRAVGGLRRAHPRPSAGGTSRRLPCAPPTHLDAIGRSLRARQEAPVAAELRGQERRAVRTGALIVECPAPGPSQCRPAGEYCAAGAVAG